jgi:hypothetical protein
MEIATKPTQKLSLLTLLVELRLRIYEHIQDPTTLRHFDWGDSVTVSAPCIVERSAIALTKTCKQIKSEVFDHYCSNKAYHIFMRNEVFTLRRKNPKVSGTKVQDLPLLPNTKAIRLEVTLHVGFDQATQISLAEEMLVAMERSTRRQGAAVSFCFSGKHDNAYKDARRINTEIIKLRMRVMSEGRKNNKRAKDMEVEFGLRAVEQLKGMQVVTQARQDS